MVEIKLEERQSSKLQDPVLKIFKKGDFEKLRFLEMPFIENVLKEGKRIA